MQTKLASDTIEMICRTSPIISTPSIDNATNAAPLAKALTRGRLPVIQVSIRARNAASVIREIAQVPDAIVGAGMILSPDDVQIAREAGAQFCSTPGITDPLLRYFDGIEMPLLPGVVTPTEAMHLLSRGYTTLNFYPGGSMNALETLKAMHPPLPQIRFSVSGNIGLDAARDYLSMPNVLNVASDCVAPAELIESHDWDTITRHARTFSQRKS
ncbi:MULTISPECIES: bifunctional 4-hydroxy-2-oxoglutarate aldolase/2-dehydro-3-deoxy-phosphogluconate aldolase [unclassified Roseovarius]|uniref:bifunctional 4-hydroxy-2-oxoglutarate aldolase/2-dehydro-3-deoxy-phosphogluconate aldolase n=1 Tax=unclassified Roseovarius TaxID=2614913 RepID=UPI00273F13D1|nr:MULTISPECIES: bifunctional 4-hydroxy-2-oxoglutarate aldolase/2-dehydro-3-deoxy-phosphogluconate aldolase [unclassified Roseovarius]